LLDQVFEPFLNEAPLGVRARGVRQRIRNPPPIDSWFPPQARHPYPHELLFASLVERRGRVVLRPEPSVPAAYRKLAKQLPVSDPSVSNQLPQVEWAVAAARVRDSARRVAPVLRARRASLPPRLPGYRSKFLDGNHRAATAQRREALRRTWAAPWPGLALVVLGQESRTVTDVLLTEEGHAQERAWWDAVGPLVSPGEVGVADRNFGTPGFRAARFARRGCLVLRPQGNVQGTLLGQRKSKGRWDTGWVAEQRLRLRGEQGPVREVRRLTAVLGQPTRDGATEIPMRTNLPAKTVPAVRGAEVDRKRWTIEGLFFEASAVRSGEIDTRCYPKAALLAFGLGLLACNAVALLKAALRAEHGEEVVSQRWSAYYLVPEIRQTDAGRMVAIPPGYWLVFEGLDDIQMAQALRSRSSKMF
jgi:hypothetical protein